MARWRVLRAVRSESRVGVGEERDLLAGSIWMGRRVNVSSIVRDGRLGWRSPWAEWSNVRYSHRDVTNVTLSRNECCQGGGKVAAYFG